MTFQPFDGPEAKRPANRADEHKLFGNPSSSDPMKPSPAWERANLIECHGKNAMPGAVARFYFKTHRIVEPYAREAFRRCEEAAPGYVERAASYVYRRIRHRASGPLSYHAYGAAIDINSDDNRAREFEPGHYVEPWSPAWLKLWPHGMPPVIVEAFESCGFSWGGRWKGYCDPMHFEWVGRSEAKV